MVHAAPLVHAAPVVHAPSPWVAPAPKYVKVAAPVAYDKVMMVETHYLGRFFIKSNNTRDLIAFLSFIKRIGTKKLNR